jgi:hypothetical protein
MKVVRGSSVKLTLKMSTSQKTRKLPRRSVKKRVRYAESDVEDDELIELVKYGEDNVADYYEELDNEIHGEDDPEADGFVVDDSEKESSSGADSSSESASESSEPSDGEDEEIILEEDEKPKKMTREKIAKQTAKIEMEQALRKEIIAKEVGPKYLCPTKDATGQTCGRQKNPRQKECSKCQSYRTRRPDGISDKDWQVEKDRRKAAREQARQDAMEDRLAMIEHFYAKRLKK